MRISINSTLAIELRAGGPGEIWIVGDEDDAAFDVEPRVHVEPAAIVPLSAALAEAAGIAAALSVGEASGERKVTLDESLTIEVVAGEPPEVWLLGDEDRYARVLVWPAEIVPLRDALAEAAGVAAVQWGASNRPQ